MKNIATLCACLVSWVIGASLSPFFFSGDALPVSNVVPQSEVNDRSVPSVDVARRIDQSLPEAIRTEVHDPRIVAELQEKIATLEDLVSDRDSEIAALKAKINAQRVEVAQAPLLVALAGPAEMLPDEVKSLLNRVGLVKTEHECAALMGLIQSGAMEASALFGLIQSVDEYLAQSTFKVVVAKNGNNSAVDLAVAKQDIERSGINLREQIVTKLPPWGVDNFDAMTRSFLAKL